MKLNFEKIPSIAWIVFFVGGIIAIIGSIIAIFFLLATVPGFASLIFLIIGVVYLFSPYEKLPHDPSYKIIQAGMITFFALMGMAVDQTGNVIYNAPLQLLCPPQTSLMRSVDVSHPLPGRTDLTQNFTCVDDSGKEVSSIAIGYMIALRFVEYVIIAYLFILLRSMRKSTSNKK